jgi:hypothetical protein
MKTLHTEINNGSQSQTYRETLDLGTVKVRINIKSDSYEAQCHATIEVFSPTALAWNGLASIGYDSMATPSKLLHSNKSKTATPYRMDRTNLIAQALDILDIAPAAPARKTTTRKAA